METNENKSILVLYYLKQPAVNLYYFKKSRQWDSLDAATTSIGSNVLKKNIFIKTVCYLNNHWTKSRHVCTDFNVFSTLTPNMDMKFKKSETVKFDLSISDVRVQKR